LFVWCIEGSAGCVLFRGYRPKERLKIMGCRDVDYSLREWYLDPLFIEGMPYSKPKIGGHPNKVVHVRDETAQFEINGAVTKVAEEHGRFEGWKSGYSAFSFF